MGSNDYTADAKRDARPLTSNKRKVRADGIFRRFVEEFFLQPLDFVPRYKNKRAASPCAPCPIPGPSFEASFILSAYALRAKNLQNSTLKPVHWRRLPYRRQQAP